MTEQIDTSIRRITLTSPAAFFSALAGVLMSLVILGAFAFVHFSDDGPWLTPQGTTRSMVEVYAFVGLLALIPLVFAAPIWSWAVWRWRFVLRDCREARGRILSIEKPKPDIWIVRFSYRNEGSELKGRSTVRPAPWIRALIAGKSSPVLVSNRNARRALPRAFFAIHRPAEA